MWKLLRYVCLLGLCVNIVNVTGEGQYDYYYGDESQELPTVDEEQKKPTVHKVESLDEHEDIFNGIIKFTNNKNDEHFDSIEDYQIEDNRSEAEIRDEDFNPKQTSDARLEDSVQPINEDMIKSTKANDELYHDEFEEDIKKILDETQDETSNKDILEETKAILNEDNDNEISDILSNNRNKYLDNKETSEIEENTVKNQSSNLEKSNAFKKPTKFIDIKKDLDELAAVRSKLFVEDSDEETKLGYDLSDEAGGRDYQEIGDDDLYKIFSDEKEESIYDDDEEEIKDVFPEHKKKQIYYSNDALSASDSTPTENSNVAGSTATTESAVQAQMTQLETTTQLFTEPELVDKISTQVTRESDFEKSVIQEFTDLDSKEQDEFNEKYGAERAAHSAATSIVQIHLTINDSMVVTSPNYPSNYPTEQITDYVITGEGQGIELNVTDFSINSFVGDYVLIIPGETEEKGSDGILLTYSLRSERRFRFTDVDRMFIRFETKVGMQLHRGFSMSLRNIMVRTDAVERPEPEEDTVHFTINETLTINIGGVNMNGFISKEEDFRRLVADMATLYINSKGIEPGLNATSDVAQILSRGLCFHNWPGSDLCTEIIFSVPLVYDNETLETRLTKKDLREMWDTYSGRDPFAVRLERMGIQEFTYPDDETTLTVWLVIATGVVISMTMLAFALWRFSCFEEYTKMPAFSDTDSVNEKKALDLYPTPHQMLPPLYTDDNVKWADEVYSTKDVGFSNKSFMRDVYDMDSDDETLRTPDRRYTTDV